MDPANPFWRMLYAHQLYMNRRKNEGDAIADLMVKETPDLTVTSLTLFIKNALRGEREAALSDMTEDVRRFGEWDEIISWILAQGYAVIGENDEALRWLENAADRGFINYPFPSELDPLLENIRGEDRFKKLMERVKRERENFEV